jgi:hypothetical protein
VPQAQWEHLQPQKDFAAVFTKWSEDEDLLHSTETMSGIGDMASASILAFVAAAAAVAAVAALLLLRWIRRDSSTRCHSLICRLACS